jgi:hypothetical protein
LDEDILTRLLEAWEKTEQKDECTDDDDAFYLFLQKQKIAREPYTPPWVLLRMDDLERDY